MTDDDKNNKNDKFSILNKKDVLILQKLLEDGRKSSSSISKEIDLGREIVNYRIKRLIKENLIVKFIPKINEDVLTTYKEYIILLKLNLDDEISREEFIKKEIGNKYLVWIVKSNSGWDLIVRLYAESVDEFKNKLSEILENYSEVLARYYTIISTDEIKHESEEFAKKQIFQNYENSDDKDFKIIKKLNKSHIVNSENVELDDKNKQIISILESDGRIQYKEIANRLQISSDTVKYRIDKMREQNIIDSIIPVINYNKLGFTQYACILKFSFLTISEEEKLNKILNDNKFITKAIKSINSNEYFLNLVCPKNICEDKIVGDLELEFKDKIDKLELFKID